jgi:hypothetical protein
MPTSVVAVMPLDADEMQPMASVTWLSPQVQPASWGEP